MTRMDGPKYIALLVVALVIGVSLPIITYYASQKTMPSTTTYTTTYKPADLGSLFEEPPRGRLFSFESYADLISFLESNTPFIQAGAALHGITGIYAVTLGIESGGAVPSPANAYSEIRGVRETSGVATPTSSIEYSTTNVQVAGVDEPDSVKTNGRIIAYARGSSVYLIDPDTMDVVYTLDFSPGRVHGLFMAGDDLIVIKQTIFSELRLYEKTLVVSYPGGAGTTIFVYDVSDPHSPLLKYSITINGYLRGARLIDDAGYFVFNIPVYTITMSYLVPAVNGEPVPPETITVINPGDLIDRYTMILSLNITTGEHRTVSFLTGMGTWMYMSHKHLVLTSNSLGGIYYALYKALFSKLMKYLTPMQQNEIATRIEEKNYIDAMKLVQKYLADRLSSLEPDERETLINDIRSDLGQITLVSNTTIHVFSINGLSVNYMGNLTAPGNILDQFSIDEYMGRYLVVATTRDIYRPVIDYRIYTIPETPGGDGEIRVTVYKDGESTVKTYSVSGEKKPEEVQQIYVYIWVKREETDNTVTIYDLNEMMQISQLTGIAKGERIYAARLLNDLFILVTYRQVDPLFAINISDPYNPEIIGFLEIPGFSEYIHPLGSGTIIGIGREDTSLKIGLYNITDPRNIEEISKLLVQTTYSPVLRDHHAFTIDPVYKRFYIPFETWGANYTGGILAISYEDYSLDIVKAIGLRGATRTVYIDGRLFLFGFNTVKVLDRADLEEIGEISLQTTQ